MVRLYTTIELSLLHCCCGSENGISSYPRPIIRGSFGPIANASFPPRSWDAAGVRHSSKYTEASTGTDSDHSKMGLDFRAFNEPMSR